MEFNNKNDKQIYYNQIKGSVAELNDNGDFCNITINCGHENMRLVNLTTKKMQFEKIAQKHAIGDRVVCRFYLASNKKHHRWYTAAILLSISYE